MNLFDIKIIMTKNLNPLFIEASSKNGLST